MNKTIMKKLFTTISLISALFFGVALSIQAATVIDTDTGTECVYTGGPVESTLCYLVTTTTTYNSPSPAGNVLVTVEHTIHDGGGLAWFDFMRCDGGPCASTDVTTNVNGWGTVGRGASGSVNPFLSAGTYNLTLTSVARGASGLATCRWYGDPACTLINDGYTSGGTLIVNTPASVNLQIGSIIDKLIDLFI